VKVSTENGAIKIGDTLTSSSIPGVAMKATKAGSVIGRAMAGYDGEGIGKVMAFVNVSSIGGIGVQVVDALDQVGDVAVEATQSAGLSVVTTDKVVAQTIEVEHILASQIDGLSEMVAAEASRAAEIARTDLEQSITSRIFAQLSEWFAGVKNLVFGGDITFIGQLTLGSKSAGEVVLSKDATEVVVNFEKAYARTPIVSVSPSTSGAADDVAGQALLSGELRYLVVNKTENGFTIRLNKSAPADIVFSWTALQRKEVTTTPVSSVVVPSSTPSPMPSPVVSPSPEASVVVAPTSTPTPIIEPEPVTLLETAPVASESSVSE
jgi:hypothetical protein